MMRERLTRSRRTIVGVNIGKTKVVAEEDAIADYVKSTRLVGPLADYLVVNVSSPNTPGLRNLQAVEKLRPLLAAVDTALKEVCDKPPPLLVKIAPDLSDEDVDAVADLSLELGLAGIIATNTTIGRDGLDTPRSELESIGMGGLSGAPLKARSFRPVSTQGARRGALDVDKRRRHRISARRTRAARRWRDAGSSLHGFRLRRPDVT